jgi:hypothetical protein
MRFSITGALAVAVMLGLSVGCSGDMKQTAGCRSSAECDGKCKDPNVPIYGGCGMFPAWNCWDNESCLQGPGGTCHAVQDQCEPDGWGARCKDACAVDSECHHAGRTDFVCNADNACVPQRCDQGFACPAYQACDPSSIDPTKGVAGLTHGCVFVPCVVDGDCAQGVYCVNGVCQESLGICILPGPETPNA